MTRLAPISHVFFFNDTATTEIYTLSLHDALPISQGQEDCRRRHRRVRSGTAQGRLSPAWLRQCPAQPSHGRTRSEEHTSELQSRLHLVCRLLLEKKNLLKRCARARSRAISTCNSR